MNKHKLALKTINEAIERFPEVGSLYETKSIIIYGYFANLTKIKTLSFDLKSLFFK